MIRRCFVVVLAMVPAVCGIADDKAAAGEDAGDPRQVAQALLRQYCFDCHGDGANEGELTLDEFAGANDQAKHPELGRKVFENLRSGVMPPIDAEKPTRDELEAITTWIKSDVFGIDAENPDPGRLVIRRLNRAEYGNTINDLMGIRFNAKLIFPADDSGHGFDNVGDALSFSPMLMEKYFTAARMVVDQAVPKQSKIVPLQVLRGPDFLDSQGRAANERLDGKRSHELTRTLTVEEPGRFHIDLTVASDGSFDYDPARYTVDFLLDGERLFSNEYGWDDGKLIPFHFERQWEAGSHVLEFRLTPIVQESDDEEETSNPSTSVRFEIREVRIEGPEGTDRLVHPPNYERFFTRDQPPESPAERREYASELIRRFARKAFRAGLGRNG